jgi:hypothetical protein
LSLVNDTTLKPPPFVLLDMLHRSMVMVLGGASKSGKTFLLLLLALAVASGKNWLKWIPYVGRVLYVNCEIPEAFLKRRLVQLCNALNIDTEKLANIDVLTLRGLVLDIDQVVRELTERIRGGEYVLIIVDPVYKLMGSRDENSASDIGNLCILLGKLATQTGAAVAYAAHFAKGNQAGRASLDRISGSGVFARDADVIVTLTRHRQEGCYIVEPTLRNCPPVQPFVIEWKHPVVLLRDDLSPLDFQAKGTKGEKGSKQATLSLEKLMTLFPESVGEDPRAALFSASELRTQFQVAGWPRAEAEAQLDVALEKGLLRRAVGAHNVHLVGRPDNVDAYLQKVPKAKDRKGGKA